MLPARNRMTRSAEFGATVRHGLRSAQPDIVVHARREAGAGAASGPHIGLVVSRSVGGAVERNRVARRLRHVARTVVGELDPADRIVIRALPGSRHALSARLQQELRVALRRIREAMERSA